ncbi:MAG: hypothetical protein AMXMBFR59_11930 [Rhodanobacteraceae bacterium]
MRWLKLSVLLRNSKEHGGGDGQSRAKLGYAGHARMADPGVIEPRPAMRAVNADAGPGLGRLAISFVLRSEGDLAARLPLHLEHAGHADADAWRDADFGARKYDQPGIRRHEEIAGQHMRAVCRRPHDFARRRAGGALRLGRVADP